MKSRSEWLSAGFCRSFPAFSKRPKASRDPSLAARRPLRRPETPLHVLDSPFHAVYAMFPRLPHASAPPLQQQDAPRCSHLAKYTLSSLFSTEMQALPTKTLRTLKHHPILLCFISVISRSMVKASLETLVRSSSRCHHQHISYISIYILYLVITHNQLCLISLLCIEHYFLFNKCVLRVYNTGPYHISLYRSSEDQRQAGLDALGGPALRQLGPQRRDLPLQALALRALDAQLAAPVATILGREGVRRLHGGPGPAPQLPRSCHREAEVCPKAIPDPPPNHPPQATL